MDAEIECLDKWARERLPDSDDGIFTGPYQAHYVDDLMRDMGMPTNRTNNFLTEYMGTFLPSRYGSLGQDLRDATQKRGTRRSDFYFSSRHGIAAIILAAVFWFGFG